MVEPYYRDALTTLYHGDARDILPELPRASVLITDPPYGVNWAGHSAGTREWSAIAGDADDDMARWLFTRLDCADDAVVFGANYFPHLLPHRGRWICWDKRLTDAADRMLGSPFEIAWTSKQHGFDRMYRIMHGGVVNDDGGRRVHPTQKPVRLFAGIMADMFPDAESVVDPFAGSGSVLVAARLSGVPSVGIEIDRGYCDAIAERLSQGLLFGMGRE
jgi:site-specific DNA-methyltransferase (adenine-specific)